MALSKEAQVPSNGWFRGRLSVYYWLVLGKAWVSTTGWLYGKHECLVTAGSRKVELLYLVLIGSVSSTGQ